VLDRLYRMIATVVANILRVTRDPRDWNVIRDRCQSDAEALLYLLPELVFSGGELKHASAAWAGRLPPQQCGAPPANDSVTCWVRKDSDIRGKIRKIVSQPGGADTPPTVPQNTLS
jgi:hypothetical protein